MAAAPLHLPLRASAGLRALAIATLLAVLALGAGSARAAQPTVGLGTAGSYGVLAASTVTNTGPSTINGDLGLSPGTAVTGFPPGTVNGATHVADAAAAQAQADLTTAYNDAAGRTPASTVAGDLGGQTLTPGVYKSASSLGLTGTVTLNAQGDAGAVFIVQVGSALTTASGSSVSLINGAQACNVFWQIGSSATFGTNTVFSGSVLALTSISFNDGVTLAGRALARNGAVTLIDDHIAVSQCAASTTGGAGSGGGTTGTGGGTTDTGGTGGTTGTGGGTGTTVARPVLARSACTRRMFRAVVTGKRIKSVVFSLDGHVISSQASSPFAAWVGPGTAMELLTARVTFTDGTNARTLRLRFRPCASARRRVSPARRPITPSGFTGR
ncbi:MAG: hypothetical protein JWM71_1036 [Solirubrobacteraceae bacterium]|nr:hypothetical protein [Solirubrobacteraceae bacterium]